MRIHKQKTRYASPWPLRVHITRQVFRFVWIVFCRYSPKHLYKIRSIILRLFGAKIGKNCFVDSRARIYFPWNLEMADNACIAYDAEVYNLDKVILETGAVIAQSVFICCGTHDFNSNTRELITGEIKLSQNCFIGARSIILPGVEIGENTIVAAGSVVPKSIDHNVFVAGNPAVIKRKK